MWRVIITKCNEFGMTQPHPKIHDYEIACVASLSYPLHLDVRRRLSIHRWPANPQSRITKGWPTEERFRSKTLKGATRRISTDRDTVVPVFACKREAAFGHWPTLTDRVFQQKSSAMMMASVRAASN